MNLEDYTLGDLVSSGDLQIWKDLCYLYKFCEEKDDSIFDLLGEEISKFKRCHAEEIGRQVLDGLMRFEKEIK
jgi:hypothetical protein